MLTLELPSFNKRFESFENRNYTPLVRRNFIRHERILKSLSKVTHQLILDRISEAFKSIQRFVNHISSYRSDSEEKKLICIGGRWSR